VPAKEHQGNGQRPTRSRLTLSLGNEQSCRTRTVVNPNSHIACTPSLHKVSSRRNTRLAGSVAIAPIMAQASQTVKRPSSPHHHRRGNRYRRGREKSRVLAWTDHPQPFPSSSTASAHYREWLSTKAGSLTADVADTGGRSSKEENIVEHCLRRPVRTAAARGWRCTLHRRPVPLALLHWT
jgi:hypothetical protein